MTRHNRSTTILPRILFILLLLILPKQSQSRWLYFGSTQDEEPDAVVTAAAVKPPTPPPDQQQQQRQTPPPSTNSGSNFILQFLTGHLSDVFKIVLHKLGNYLPIRGVASVAADLGIPGGEFVMDALTSNDSPPAATVTDFKPTVFTPVRNSVESRQPNSAASINPRFAAWARTDMVDDQDPPVVSTPPPSYREEVSSIMGTMFGEKQCLMKLACLSGKRLSAVKGASALTMVLSTVAGVMPESLQDPYQALRNSIMYTDDCQQYQCSEVGNSEL